MLNGGGFARYYKMAGVRGVAAAASNRVLHFPRELAVRPPSVQAAVHLRLRTSDIFAYQEVLLGREYDFDVPSEPRVIFDIGANIGMAALFFANKYPKARIIAVEAEKSNFDLLKRNVAPYPSITPVHAALWGSEKEISVLPTPGGNWAFVTQEGTEGELITAVTIKSLMRQFNVTFIDVLKVDIEGAEKEVFESCDWMDMVGLMAIELHDRLKPGCSAAVEAHMQGFIKSGDGYTTLYRRTVEEVPAITLPSSPNTCLPGQAAVQVFPGTSPA